MSITIKTITRGPHKGRVSWSIDVEKKPLIRGGVPLWGKRNGIAKNESQAKSTAAQQLKWHQKRQEWRKGR